MWNQPEGGLHAYLVRFLSSSDITFQHIAVWTIVQLLESEDEKLAHNIRSSPILTSSIRQLAESPPASRAGRRETQQGQGSDDDYDDEGLMEGDGEGEIASLARRILDLTEDGRVEGEGGSHFVSHAQGQAGKQDEEGGQGQGHAALRASVHQALRGQ